MGRVRLRHFYCAILLGWLLCLSRLSGYEVLILGDLHYDAPDLKLNLADLLDGRKQESKRNFARWEQFIPQMLEEAGKKSAKCAFAVQLGDLTQGDFCRGNLHAEALRRARVAVVDRMECPTYFVKGNHDVRGTDAESAYAKTMLPWLDKQFQQVHHGKGTNYALRRKHDLFLFFDCMAPDVAFVEETLAKEKEVRHIFFLTHIPLVPCSNGSPGWILYWRNATERNRLLTLLAKKNVIVLCAHTHAPSYFVYRFSEGSIRQLVTFSMPASPAGEFKREDGGGRVKAFLQSDGTGKYPMDAPSRQLYLDALRSFEFYSPTGGYAVLHIGETAVEAELFYGNFQESTAKVKLALPKKESKPSNPPENK